jgi:hypothetical protein
MGSVGGIEPALKLLFFSTTTTSLSKRQTVMPSKTPFVALKLLPEFFPLIASHLPLYATPSTLLALALTNSQIYHIVHDLLYSRLILRNEKDAISIFQRILTNPDLGRAVRELHVMSELTVPTINGETLFDTVTGLKKVINNGSLPYIHTFVVRLLKECRHNEDWSYVNGFGHFPKDFWDDLRIKCPRVRTLVLSGVGDENSDPWLNQSGIYELEGMKVCGP